MPPPSTYTPLFDADEDDSSPAEAEDSDGIPLKPLASTSSSASPRRRRDSFVETSDNHESDDEGEEKFGLMDRRRRSSRSTDAGVEGKEEDVEPLFRDSFEGVDDALAMVRSVSQACCFRCSGSGLSEALELNRAAIVASGSTAHELRRVGLVIRR